MSMPKYSNENQNVDKSVLWKKYIVLKDKPLEIIKLILKHFVIIIWKDELNLAGIITIENYNPKQR